jgi:hypothetical protein
MKSSIFWDIMPCRIWGSHSGGYEEFYLLECSPLKVNRYFGWVFRLLLRGQEEFCLLPASRWFLAWFILRPWRWRHVSTKRRMTLNRLHGVISQKILHFIFFHCVLLVTVTTLSILSSLSLTFPNIYLIFYFLKGILWRPFVPSFTKPKS